MEIQKYRLYGARTPASRAQFDEHLTLMATPGNSWREFRTSEVVPAATYAVQYFVDAVQDILFDTMHVNAQSPVDTDLPSGWRVKALDTRHHWMRHLEFSSATDPETGFILEATLERNRAEKPSDGQSYSRADIASRMLERLRDNSPEMVVKENTVTTDFDPANSKRFDSIAVYPYHSREGGYDSRDKVVSRLVASQYVHETFEHRPHRKIDVRSLPAEMRSEYSMVPITTAGRGATPGEAFEVLPILSEYLSVVDREALVAALDAHVETVHFTLDEDLWFLLSATRSCLNTASDNPANYPPSSLTSMVEELWSRTVCADILHFLPEIDEASAALISLGHTSCDDTFECNDGRTRVYAVAEDDGYKVFVDLDDTDVCVTVRGDRIVFSMADYEAESDVRSLFDFTAEDGVVTGVNDIAPYADKLAGLLPRTMVDLSSVHCHIVPPKEDNSVCPALG